MFLRVHTRRKNGKLHRYFSVVENRRVAGGPSVQRQVMYLGEINDRQQAAWRKTLEVFDEDRQEFREISLFPDDRTLPAEAVDAVTVKLGAMQLRRPRAFGDCWLACGLWDQLELTAFWKPRLAEAGGRGSGGARAGVPWEKVLEVLTIKRLLDPGSGTGSLPAPWTNCWAWTSRRRPRTGSIAASTGWWRTRRRCSNSSSSGGGRYLTHASTSFYTI
jgi:hypothetical protein